jgi:hypothetical protein
VELISREGKGYLRHMMIICSIIDG